jgi:hypothetical protein
LELFKLSALCIDLVGVSLFISELLQSWWHRRNEPSELMDAAQNNVGPDEANNTSVQEQDKPVPTEEQSLIEQEHKVAVI